MPSVNRLAGPQILGFLMNWGLQGVLSTQIYLYHIWFQHDTFWIKALVYGVFIWECVQTGLITSDAYMVYVYSYGNVNVLTSFNNSWFSVVIMTAIVAAVVQILYAWRILVLTGTRVFSAVIAVFALGIMTFGIVVGSKIKNVKSAAEASAVTPLVSGQLLAGAVLDVGIAVIMTVTLVRARSGVNTSDRLVRRLVTFVVETGSLTASVAIMEGVLFVTLSDTLLYECPGIILTKLYANALVTSFNNRAFFNSGHAGNIADSTLVECASGNNYPTSSGSSAVPNAVRINVTHESFALRDLSLPERAKEGADSDSGVKHFGTMV